MNAAAEKEKLYTEYRDKVMGYIFGKLQNRHDSEVCQAVSMWPEIARECEVPQKMIKETLPNMVFF